MLLFILRQRYENIFICNPNTVFLNFLSVGSKSTLVGSKSTLVGNKSTLVGSKSTLVGSKSTLVGSKSILVGNKSTLVGSKYTLVGNSPTLVGKVSARCREVSARCREIPYTSNCIYFYRRDDFLFFGFGAGNSLQVAFTSEARYWWSSTSAM